MSNSEVARRQESTRLTWARVVGIKHKLNSRRFFAHVPWRKMIDDERGDVDAVVLGSQELILIEVGEYAVDEVNFPVEICSPSIGEARPTLAIGVVVVELDFGAQLFERGRLVTKENGISGAEDVAGVVASDGADEIWQRHEGRKQDKFVYFTASRQR